MLVAEKPPKQIKKDMEKISSRSLVLRAGETGEARIIREGSPLIMNSPGYVEPSVAERVAD